MIKLFPLYLLMIVIFSCSTIDKKQPIHCSEDKIASLQEKAWAAKKNNHNLLARDLFIDICNCQYSEGCLNASAHYSSNDSEWHLLQHRACDLGNGNACFWLGESVEGSAATSYYEKGCSVANADGAACRMAGLHNIGNDNKASVYFEKGCSLADIQSCIKAFEIIKEPARLQGIKTLSCEFDIQEICQ